MIFFFIILLLLIYSLAVGRKSQKFLKQAEALRTQIHFISISKYCSFLACVSSSSPFKRQAMHDTTYWQSKHLTVSIHIAINVETSDTSPRAHKNKPTNTHTHIYRHTATACAHNCRLHIDEIVNILLFILWTRLFLFLSFLHHTMCRYAFIMLINNSTFSYILDGHAIDFYVCSAHSNVHCKAALFFIWFGFALNNLYGFSFTPSIFHPFVHSFMLNERWARTHMSDASEQEVFRFH